MIYSVQFVYKPDSIESVEIQKAVSFFDDLKNRDLITRYQILKNQNTERAYTTLLYFETNNILNKAMKQIATIGIRSGLHGAMIENVSEFSVAFYDEVSQCCD